MKLKLLLLELIVIAILVAAACRAEPVPEAARPVAAPPQAAPPAALFQWRQPTLVEAAPLGLALGLIWTDVAQTRAFRRIGVAEANPLLGNTPSQGKVFWMGGVLSSALLIAAWYALPTGWRILPAAAVIGVETDAVLHNAGVMR